MPVRYFCGHCGELIKVTYFVAKPPKRCPRCDRELGEVERVEVFPDFDGVVDYAPWPEGFKWYSPEWCARKLGLEPGKWYAVVADSEGNVAIAETMEEALEKYKELAEEREEGGGE